MTAPADRDYRLRSGTRIGEMFALGRRAGDGRMLLVALPNDLGHPRLAVAVSRKHGKAVKRNRLKRLCREAFRAVRGKMAGGWDLVLVPRVRDDHTVDALAQSLLRLWPRLARKDRSDGDERPA